MNEKLACIIMHITHETLIRDYYLYNRVEKLGFEDKSEIEKTISKLFSYDLLHKKWYNNEYTRSLYYIATKELNYAKLEKYIRKNGWDDILCM